ncbi:Phosphoglycolate phosphatase [Streptomyces sp. RB5]|uniref:Phosphoglycolate phosphatase n=1 Tax=Streptomyces smaragdinus TaxID=2585196 RepID=A0A7K0CS39_9ACTN|nr:HAD family hydrolase [Streptomyces smaragdinus]MQY16315.1 Phosphoglycolate phosphatase [Streptomyces smaragdinus]
MVDIREPSEHRALRLLASARCVLFDFDGPVCSLFAGRRPQDITARLRDWAASEGYAEVVRPTTAAFADAYTVFRELASRGVDPVVVAAVERRLAREEFAATATARPTPYADALIRTLHDHGRRIAVATNNAEEPVMRYLRGRGLAEAFDGQVHGRRHDGRLLKPHPDCLRRALAATGTAPAETLMIGDSRGDRDAARALGIPFIGYATRPGKRTSLEGYGVPLVVDSLAPLLRAAAALAPLPRA